MNLKHSLVLGLVLACLGQAAESASGLPPKESPDPLRTRQQQNAPQAVQPVNPSLGKTGPVVMPSHLAHPASVQVTPSKEERMANWRGLPALEAYHLFKELGQEMPLELARQFNASLVVNTYDESLRQAGGSPMTAVTIPSTNPGDTFGDSGSTLVLSNYLANVPYLNGPCQETGGFYGNDAWYTFTLAAPTQVAADLCASDGSYDPLLGIFNTSLDMVASNDDACGAYGMQSAITCCLEAGTYYLVVDGFYAGAGNYQLGVAFNTCPTGPNPTHGGPDAFGYTWNITGDAEDTPFEWQDISGIGTAVALTDDSYTITPIPLPFIFRYYGVDYTQVYIGSNGLIGFAESGMHSLSNTILPNGFTPNNLIAAFWDDLNPGVGGTIHTFADSYYGRFFIQYTGVPAFGEGGSYTFQIVLNQGGDIVIHHLDLQDSDISQATVGIENANGTDGLTVNLNGSGAALGDAKTVHFHYPSSTGGSDWYGYTWTSSRAPEGPASYFTDISWANDLNITLDDTYAPVALPFPFTLYGTTYNTVYVSSNGLLTFAVDGASSYNNGSLPFLGVPNALICPYWDDLDPEHGGAVYYYDDVYNTHAAIFQWNAVAHNGDFITNDYVSHFTFQVLLFPDGSIDFNYGEMSGNYTGSATVGLEDGTGTLGLLAQFNGHGASTLSGTTLRFRPPQPRPTRGGPTAGYEWANSQDTAGPANTFDDISTTGIDLGLVGDDQTVVVALPFAFPWFGEPEDSVSVCSNGWVSFDPTMPGFYSNEPIAGSNLLHNMVCAFWDDLFPPLGGHVYYKDDSANGRVIFQWHEIPHINGADGPYTFQLLLYTNGEISINYGPMGATAFQGVNSATVGVENRDGSDGLQVNFNNTGGLIADHVSVVIAPIIRTPSAITDLRIVQDAVTNGQPFLYHYEWSPVTTDTYGNTMAVDYYDFYYTTGLNPYAPFPSGWSYFTAFYTPYTPSLSHYAEDIAVRIVAVDTDGFVVSRDATPGAAPVRAETLRSMARQGDGTVLRLAETPTTR